MTSKREWKARAKFAERWDETHCCPSLGDMQAERDRARELAALLEEEIYFDTAHARPSTSARQPWPNTSASPTPESIMRDFDALEATGWLGP